MHFFSCILLLNKQVEDAFVNIMSRGKVFFEQGLRKGNQFAIPLIESLPRLAFLLTKDSVLATN